MVGSASVLRFPQGHALKIRQVSCFLGPNVDMDYNAGVDAGKATTGGGAGMIGQRRPPAKKVSCDFFD